MQITEGFNFDVYDFIFQCSIIDDLSAELKDI